MRIFALQVFYTAREIPPQPAWGCHASTPALFPLPLSPVPSKGSEAEIEENRSKQRASPSEN